MSTPTRNHALSRFITTLAILGCQQVAQALSPPNADCPKPNLPGQLPAVCDRQSKQPACLRHFGWLYESVVADPTQAIQCYELAVKGGDNEAAAQLGLLYLNRAEAPEDAARAIGLLEPAAEAGSLNARYTLGLVYRRGQVVAQNYETALYWLRKAAQQDGSEQLRILVREVELEAELASDLPPGANPFLLAVVNNDRDTVRRFIANGIPPDQTRNASGLTGLAIALLHGHIELADLLHASGADANPISNEGFSLAHLLVQENRLRSLQWLISAAHERLNVTNAEGFTSLLVAVQDNNAEAVHLLVEGGADVHDPGEVGFPPIVSAASAGNTAMVAELLSLGANVNAQSVNGATPLHYAISNDQASLVDLLLKYCPRSDLKSDRGHTALTLARMKADQKLVRRLKSECNRAS